MSATQLKNMLFAQLWLSKLTQTWLTDATNLKLVYLLLSNLFTTDLPITALEWEEQFSPLMHLSSI